MRMGNGRGAACGLAALLLVLLVLTASVPDAAKDGPKPAEKAKAPSVVFQPGAEVTFNFYFVVPAGHHLSEEPLAVVAFDGEALAGLPVNVEPLSYYWTDAQLLPERAKNGMQQTTKAAQVKVKLAADCPPGELKIPTAVDVFFCNDEEGWCTNSHYDAVLTVVVSGGEKSVKHGALKVCVVANPPEM